MRVGVIGTTSRRPCPSCSPRPESTTPTCASTSSTGPTPRSAHRWCPAADLAVVSLPVLEDELATSLLFEEDLTRRSRRPTPWPRRRRTATAPSRCPSGTLEELDLLLPLRTVLRDEIDAELAHEGYQVHLFMEPTECA